MLNAVPHTDQASAASGLITQDLPLLWASLVAFGALIPAGQVQTHAHIKRVLIALEREQKRRHTPQSAPIMPKLRPGAA
jgi:hypothetical protein